MDHLQSPAESNDQEWKQRCNERMEKLKIARFPTQDASSQQEEQEQEKLREEKHIMNFELYEAVENGNEDRFVDVLEQVFADTELTLFAIFDQVTPSGDSLLHVAADLGRERIAELIAYHFPGLLFGTNIRGDTALHVAARSKNCNIIKIILSQVEGLTKLTNANGDTPLHAAVCSRNLAGIIELLLADSQVVHYLNNSGKSPLYLAVTIGDVDILDLLLQTPFPSNKPLPQSHGNSPLHAAILERNSDMLKEILKRKPELIYLRDENGGTSLHYAAYIGYIEGVRILLNVSTLTALERNSKGDLPIHIACKRGHVIVVEELLQQEWPNPRIFLNYEGQNILHVAAKDGKTNVIKYLLRNKKIDWITLNEKDNNGDTPLHLASKNLFVGVMNEITQDKRIDVNLLNNEGLSANDVVWKHSKFPSTIQEYLALAILSYAGVPRINKATSTLCHHQDDGLKDRIDTRMLMAILIATVAFLVASNFFWLVNVITITGSLFLVLIALLYILLVSPLKVRHPQILHVASLFIEILILFVESSDKVMTKDHQNSDTKQVDKGKQKQN
ncbi:hypothetical protein RIF29_31434 [Crotalaria pallida]|uniref:Ankyrin repeat protein n=1 Tax=Crotalaria pallida TaxID=3830 RepID=A0AAN9EMG8_CROPI